MKKKLCFVFATVLVVMGLFAACGNGGSEEEGKEEATQKVVIGTQELMNVEAIAKAEGYFEEAMEGADVEIKIFDAGRDLTQALSSGDVDFGVMGAMPLTVGLASGIDYKVIYSTALITESEAMVAKNDSGIEEVSDLEGKKIATTFVSNTHYSLMSLLKEKGIDADKIELLDMAPDKIVAAWKRGDIDAGYTWSPALDEMKNDNGTVVITSGEVGELGYPTADFAVVRTKFADEHPEYVEGYLKALIKAEKLFADENDKANEVLAEYFETTADEIKELMCDNYLPGEAQLSEGYFEDDGYATFIFNVAKFLDEQGEIEEPLDMDFIKEHIDSSFLEEAIQN